MIFSSCLKLHTCWWHRQLIFHRKVLCQSSHCESPTSSKCQSFRNKCTKALSACAITFYYETYLLLSVSPYFFVISEPKIVPNERSVFVTSTSMLRFCPVCKCSFQAVLRELSHLLFCLIQSHIHVFGSKVTFSLGPANGLFKICRKINLCFLCRSNLLLPLSRSLRPTISSTVLTA